MAGYMIKFLIAPAQPLPGFTMMGLCAVAPVLIGPNPMRILGLIACALAGYLFCPEYRETKKLPARLAVRESLYLFDPLKAAAAAHVAKEKRLPQEGELTFKLPENDKAAVEAMAGGGFIARLKFASLEGRSVRLMPMLANENSPGNVSATTLSQVICRPNAAMRRICAGRPQLQQRYRRR